MTTTTDTILNRLDLALHRCRDAGYRPVLLRLTEGDVNDVAVQSNYHPKLLDHWEVPITDSWIIYANYIYHFRGIGIDPGARSEVLCENGEKVGI